MKTDTRPAPPPSRAHGWVDYHARMARLLEHVHTHLDDDLNLHTLAEVVHLSPHHWHRTYHALMGETLAATVRRLRLQRASGELAHSTRPVADIAQRSGYPNAQVFARAFKAAYGQSPSEFRRLGSHAALAGLGAAAPLPPGFEVTIRHVPRIRLAGLTHRGSYMGVGRAFDGALPHLQAHGQLRDDSRWVAVYPDDSELVPTAQLQCQAGLSVPAHWPVPAPLQAFEVGGAPCAVLRYQGPYSSMHAAYRWLFGPWLAASGHALADQPVFEEYLNSPRQVAPSELLTDICLPLALEQPT